jgi:hypothetical protein
MYAAKRKSKGGGDAGLTGGKPIDGGIGDRRVGQAESGAEGEVPGCVEEVAVAGSGHVLIQVADDAEQVVKIIKKAHAEAGLEQPGPNGDAS